MLERELGSMKRFPLSYKGEPITLLGYKTTSHGIAELEAVFSNRVNAFGDFGNLGNFR